MMQIYNTASRNKQVLQPLLPPKIKMYVCGMTVYDYCHVGHARVMVVFDYVARYLRFLGFDLTYVRNITDIDDKIIARAAEQHIDWRALTERFIEAMHEDGDALGVMRPDVEPKATDYMAEMIAMNRQLIDKQHAYLADNGDVYFAVRSFKGYGRLGGRDLDDLRAGARVDVDASKRDPLDFALWKSAKPGEPYWVSPWGKGRPGWHIECSAMSTCCLGEQIDIHGGGGDLTFPHHENEIAQSEAATGKTFAQTWMHVGFVQVDDEKMSKSLGNFFSIRQVLQIYRPEVLRYFIVASHYRSPLNYSDENLEQARAALERFYQTLKEFAMPEPVQLDRENPWVKSFTAAMEDDFNTPEALSVLFDLARDINRMLNDGQRAEAELRAGILRQLGSLLGILQDDARGFLKSGGRVQAQTAWSDAEVETRIAARDAAKKARDFALADSLRAELQAQGILLEDTRQGTLWRRA
ncbi:MAG: cysteine--tRNA ligase [Pseudomonadales bacterium]|nr:cysteine--tRNA ligase [Pseudomonadales bacterium]